MNFTKSELTEMLSKDLCIKAPRYIIVRELMKNQEDAEEFRARENDDSMIYVGHYEWEKQTEIIERLMNRYKLLIYELTMFEKKFPKADTHIIEYRIEELEKVLGLR